MFHVKQLKIQMAIEVAKESLKNYVNEVADGFTSLGNGCLF
jgi:hypothetical protein